MKERNTIVTNNILYYIIIIWKKWDQIRLKITIYKK